MSPKHRIESLDVLRGLCAIMVMLMHSEVLTGVNPAPSAYLAVDMFFLMSGFVLAAAYDERLRQGGFAFGFATRRISRLWPMWAIAALGGAVMPLVLARHGGYGAWLASASFGLLLLPMPRAGYLFPFNPPGWSLFCEGVANVAYAGWGHRISRQKLWLLVAIAGAAMISAARVHGSLYGGQRAADLPIGMVRAAYGFALGVALHRADLRVRLRGRGAFVCSALALLAAFLIAPPDRFRAAYDCVIVLVGCPLVMILAQATALRSPMWATYLGDLSYPLYAIHLPVMLAALAVRGIWSGWTAGYMMPPSAAGLMGATLLLSLWLGRRVDPLAQKALRHFLGRWRPVTDHGGTCQSA